MDGSKAFKLYPTPILSTARQATPCDGSSEIFPIPKQQYVCPAEGFFVDPENCRWFFACRDHLGDGTLTHYEFR